jgi:hypothetical protein
MGGKGMTESMACNVNEKYPTTARYYGGNFLKIKARKIPSKRPVQNWHYLANFNYSGEIQRD